MDPTLGCGGGGGGGGWILTSMQFSYCEGAVWPCSAWLERASPSPADFLPEGRESFGGAVA